MPFPEEVDVANPSRIDRLKVAYGLHISRKVMEADEVLDISEIEVLMKAFPEALLQSCGFIDDGGSLTEAWEHALTEAAALLPIELSTEAKLDMLVLFHRVRESDGEIHEAEDHVVASAAQHLGITRGQLAAHLKKLSEDE